MKVEAILVDPDGSVTAVIKGRGAITKLIAAAWDVIWTGRVGLRFSGRLMFHEDFMPKFGGPRPVEIDDSGEVRVGPPPFRPGQGDC